MASNSLLMKPNSTPTNIRLTRTETCSFGKITLPKSTTSINANTSCGRRNVTSTLVKTLVEDCTSLARMWKEMQGCNNWEDLISPLNPMLCEEIIRYGKFVASCYKAFDLDKTSSRYLNCKYGKKTMLREVGMEGCGYEITKYIYATPDIDIPTQDDACSSRWVGYVAVASDNEAKRLGRRDVVVSFRGTGTVPEWVANFMSSLNPAQLDINNPRPDVMVESGFLSMYTSCDSSCKFDVGSCREQILSEISRVINTYKGEEISLTMAGHSMGSSLALLSAYDIAELGLNKLPSKNIPITVYSFGGPRVGNLHFKERCEKLGIKVLRIVNIKDPVTKLPGVFMNERFRVLGGRYEVPWSCSCYAHVGVELCLDFFKMGNLSHVHDMETYIRYTRCPEKAANLCHHRSTWVDFFNKIKKFLPSTERLDSWVWEQTTKNVESMFQSLRI